MSSLLGGGGGSGTKNPWSNMHQLMKSQSGVVIPLLYGTDRITPTFIEVGNFQTIPPPDGKKFSPGGKSAPAFSTYQISAALGLCYGVINKIRRVWSSGGAGLNNTELNPSAAGSLWTLFKGAQGQNPWGAISGLHIGYSLLAYAAQEAWNLGGSSQPPQTTFEVEGILVNDPLNDKYFDIGAFDVVPSDALADLLTDPNHGCGIPVGMIGQETLGQAGEYGFFYQQFAEAWAYLQAAQLYLSILLDSQRPAAEWVNEILEICNMDLIFTNEAFYLRPYADKSITSAAANVFFPTITYNPVGSVRTFTTSDFIVKKGQPPVTIARPLSVDRYNEIRVEFKDRNKGYNQNIANAKLQTSIDNFTLRPADTLNYPHIKRGAIARMVAQLRLQRLNFAFNTYEFTVAPNHVDLDPMDIVSLTEPLLGFSAYPVRISKIEEDKNLNLKITAQDIFPGTTQQLPYQPPVVNMGSDNSAVPGSINPPFIFEPWAALTSGALQIWFSISGTDAAYGGCSVYLSKSGINGQYKKIGSCVGSNPNGYLINSIAAIPDPDIIETVTVDLSLSAVQIPPSGTSAQSVGGNLFYLDGEWMSYFSDAALPNNVWDLFPVLRRGLWGSPITSHSPGGIFAYLSSVDLPAAGIFVYTVPSTPNLIGDTLYFKFTAFNVLGGTEQKLSEVTAYPYVLAGNGASPGQKSIIVYYGPIPTSLQVLYQQTLGQNASFPSNLNGSYASLDNVSTGATVYSIHKNNVQFATATFAAGVPTATFSGSRTNFTPGDKITVVAPASPDATASGLSMTLTYS